MADFLEESQVHEDGDYLQSTPLLEFARGGRELRSCHDGMRFGVESRWLCIRDFLACIKSLTPLRSHTGNPSHLHGRERSASAVDAVGPTVTNRVCWPSAPHVSTSAGTGTNAELAGMIKDPLIDLLSTVHRGARSARALLLARSSHVRP